jgi:putative membrane protein
MYIKHRFSVFRALYWTKGAIAGFGLYSTAVIVAYEQGFEQVAIPFLPVSLLGTAVSFYLGFKNNSAYDRLWESRKVWGAIVNASRSWGILVTDYVTNHFATAPVADDTLKDIHRELLYRHLAWLTTLRHQLRARKTWEHHTATDDYYRDYYGVIELGRESREGAMKAFLDPTEVDHLLARANAATQILAKQSSRLRELHAAGLLDDFRHMELSNILVDLTTHQGKCERIKNYPLPRMYATLTVFFVWMFIAAIPLGMVAPFADMGMVWLAIPGSMVLSWVFYIWNLVGDYSENPFEGLANDTPMTALSRTIEIDLREMLGETDLPPKVKPTNGVLM